MDRFWRKKERRDAMASGGDGHLGSGVGRVTSGLMAPSKCLVFGRTQCLPAPHYSCLIPEWTTPRKPVLRKRRQGRSAGRGSSLLGGCPLVLRVAGRLRRWFHPGSHPTIFRPPWGCWSKLRSLYHLRLRGFYYYFCLFNKRQNRGLLGSPAVKTLRFQSKGCKFTPGQWTKIPHAAGHGQNFKKKKKRHKSTSRNKTERGTDSQGPTSV